MPAVGDIVNAGVIWLEDVPQGYKSFDQGAATKFMLDAEVELPKAV